MEMCLLHHPNEKVNFRISLFRVELCQVSRDSRGQMGLMLVEVQICSLFSVLVLLGCFLGNDVD